VLYTMSTAFTNFGDAHRGSKQDAIQAIEGASVTKVPGYTILSIGQAGPARRTWPTSACPPPTGRSCPPA
jgi:hypothetical protein